MKHSLSLEIPRLLWNSKFQYHVHKILPVFSGPRPIILFFKIRYSIIHLRLLLPNSLLPSGFLPKILYPFLISFMCATCLSHLIIPHFINLIVCLMRMRITKLLFVQVSLAPCYFLCLRSNSLSKSFCISESVVSTGRTTCLLWPQLSHCNYTEWYDFRIVGW